MKVGAKKPALALLMRCMYFRSKIKLTREGQEIVGDLIMAHMMTIYASVHFIHSKYYII